MSGAVEDNPRARHTAASSSIRRTGSVGSAKIAVPDLDRLRTHRQEVQHVGQLDDTADRDDRDVDDLATSYTIRSAIGLIAGPETPP